jgi:hypothetical protein
MDVLVASATMDSEGTLAAAAAALVPPIATTIAPMEAAAPAEAKCAATDGRDAKRKAAKKVLFKEEKGVETVKRRGRCKNQNERNAAAAAMEATKHMAWEMQLKASAAQVGLHPSFAEAMLLVKREGIIGVAPPASSVSSVSSQLRPGTPTPLQDQRGVSGVAPVQFTFSSMGDNTRPGS